MKLLSVIQAAINAGLIVDWPYMEISQQFELLLYILSMMGLKESLHTRAYLWVRNIAYLWRWIYYDTILVFCFLKYNLILIKKMDF